MRKSVLAITGNYFLLIIFLCVLSGCVTTSEGRAYDEGDRDVSVAYILRFDDVPVPSGFMVLDSESFAFQNDTTRVALLKYIGSVNIENVVQFYKDQMPAYNWSPINIIEYERRILNYEKGSESCIVTVEPRGRKSVIAIAISPKSRPMKVETKD